MAVCSIDAEYKSEERYSKLSLAYNTPDEYKDIENAIAEFSPLCSLEPMIYTSDISDGRKVLVIEYHDDYCREGGVVFESIMKKLDIKICT